jgi:xanthine dehydrogenase accessory factor
MSEIAGIYRTLLEERKAGRPAALATLVRTRGSSYRRAGARALVKADGTLVGGISGGCLEQDVALRASQALEQGKPLLAFYDTGADDDRLFGLNIGCGGQLEVLVEPLEGRLTELVEMLAELEKDRRRATLVTMLSPEENLGQRLLVGEAGETLLSTTGDKNLDSVLLGVAKGTEREAGLDLVVEKLAPPPALLLFGSGFDVEPLVLFGRALGFEVVVVDVRDSEAALSRFPTADRRVAAGGAKAAIEKLGGLLDRHAAALVMNHHYDNDRDLVRELLATPVGYLGLLGPQSRGRRLLAEMREENPSLETERVFSPVGLDLGADTPEKVALSILAEILAVLAGRQGGFLKERTTPIHSV